jgi:hypothetical protein
MLRRPRAWPLALLRPETRLQCVPSAGRPPPFDGLGAATAAGGQGSTSLGLACCGNESSGAARAGAAREVVGRGSGEDDHVARLYIHFTNK